MRLDYTRSSLVIVGGWNPNIVNENWIRKNLLDHSNEQLNIGISGNISSTGIPLSIPHAVFGNVRLTVSEGRLELNLIDSNDFTRIEDCAQKLCSCQPNTLVSGYGVNLIYIDNTISDDFNIIRFDSLQQKPLEESYTYKIELDGIITNITLEINNPDNKSGIGFNFHFNIDDLSKLIFNITQHTIESLNKKAVDFILNNYGFRLGD